MKTKRHRRRRKLKPIAYVLMGLIILLLVAIGFALKTLLFSNPLSTLNITLHVFFETKVKNKVCRYTKQDNK